MYLFYSRVNEKEDVLGYDHIIVGERYIDSFALIEDGGWGDNQRPVTFNSFHRDCIFLSHKEILDYLKIDEEELTGYLECYKLVSVFDNLKDCKDFHARLCVIEEKNKEK